MRKEGLIVVAGAILLAGIIAIVVLAWHHSAQAIALITPLSARTGLPALAPTATPIPASDPTPTLRPTFTPFPTATPTSSGPPDHYWLQRPIGPEGQNRVNHFYPYGSTAKGRYPVHHGVEFENPSGTPVLAVAEGTVVVAGHDREAIHGPQPNFYGKLVIIQLDETFRGLPIFALYGHLSQVQAQVGQRVEAGDVLGRVGMTGVAVGPHLHFEVRVGENSYGDTRNPELWLKPLPGHGTIAGRVVDAQGQPILEALVTLHRAEYRQEAWTYAGDRVNPDQEWGENLVMGDVPAGEYELKMEWKGEVYTRYVTVKEGKTAFVSIRTVE